MGILASIAIVGSIAAVAAGLLRRGMHKQDERLTDRQEGNWS